MKDKSTAELKADLRALLEWLASNPSGTRSGRRGDYRLFVPFDSRRSPRAAVAEWG